MVACKGKVREVHKPGFSFHGEHGEARMITIVDDFLISEVNGTLHEGNYTVMVSNDFGSVSSAPTLLQVDGTPSAHTVASIGMEMIFCPPVPLPWGVQRVKPVGEQMRLSIRLP